MADCVSFQPALVRAGAGKIIYYDYYDYYDCHCHYYYYYYCYYCYYYYYWNYWKYYWNYKRAASVRLQFQQPFNTVAAII